MRFLSFGGAKVSPPESRAKLQGDAVTGERFPRSSENVIESTVCDALSSEDCPETTIKPLLCIGKEGAAFADIQDAIDRLAALFECRLRDDSLRERMFDTLHAQLKHQTEDQEFASKRSLYRSLLLLFDSVCQFERQYQACATVHAAMETIRGELLSVLEAEDVWPIRHADNVPFDRTIHRAVEVVSATKPEFDNTVARIVKVGFRQQSRLIRPSTVVLQKYAPDSPNMVLAPSEPHFEEA